MIKHLLRCLATRCAPCASNRHCLTRGILHSATRVQVAAVVTLLLLFTSGRHAVAQIPEGSCSNAVPVLSITNELEFTGEGGDHFEVQHSADLALTEGTVSLFFTADNAYRRQGLFSKDASGYKDGGHLTAFVNDGRVEVRLQSTSQSAWIKTVSGSVSAGTEYHLAVTFGPDGFWAYLNGRMVGWHPEFDQDIAANAENLVIGASNWGRQDTNSDQTSDPFDGRIREFEIYGCPFDSQEVVDLSGHSPSPPPTDPYVMEGWLFGTDSSDVLDAALYGVNNVDGGYGDDAVVGTDQADVLDGGHGEDQLVGGEGDDYLYSSSDGREPVIAQNYGTEDDPDNEINLTTRTYYPYQPIEADDVLIGGGGADTFHFRVLINAKPHIILKHVRSDGTINWGMGGVAGENNEVHDHWVDRLGDEVIEDFSRDEGDHIEVVGHTVEVYRRVHEDSDGDGILDCTILYVRSNQGNGGGAHNKDLLGTIRVFGDLVMRSDYTVEQIDYGIYPTIYELEEAITPRVYTSVADDGAPPPYPVVDDGVLPPDGVFGMLHDVVFDGEDHIEVLHDEVFELPEGTIELRFTANDVARKQGLFSKDYTGNRDGGDITCFLTEGRVKVRLQSITDSVYVWTHQGVVLPGREYHLAVTFGPGGLAIYLNGQIMAWNAEFTQTLELNTQNMAIGANTWSRSESHPDYTRDHFAGRISDVIVYNRQYDSDQIAQLAGYAPEPPPTDPYVMDGWLYGTDSNDVLNTTAYGVHSADGGYGDDYLYSTSDGREPVIAQNYGPEDDPDNEINPTTRTYYDYQPIEADDVLVGGRGADTFHFRVLINAKPHIILKHVESDGTIDWGMGGVAGENNEVHDHWVERLGDEVIEDFSRNEGDHIEVVGHTVEVYRRVHEDNDGDGILDCTILYVRSNQGNGGGAHNKDLLGTIRVFGDLVMRSDYTVEQIDYGIYPTIYDLEEATTPRVYTSVADDGTPPPYPVVDDGVLPLDGVFGMLHDVVFDGEDHIEVVHRASFELPEGTFALRFTADDVARKQGLFSKDFSGNREGGDITCFVYGGRIKVRLQNAFTEVYAMTPEGSVLPGQEYHLAVTFGPAGIWIYLNGQAMGWQPEFTQGLDMNRQNMAIGANTWSRSESHPDYTRDHFAGRIAEFILFDHQYDQEEIAYLVDGSGTISTTTSSTSTSSTSSTSTTTDTSSTSTTSTSSTSSTTTSSSSSTTSTTTTSSTTVSELRVLYYTFDEYDGGIVADYSGNGHMGSVAGATWTSAGVCGGAYRYDAGDYIYARPSDDLNLRDNFTYIGWFKADTLAYDWNAICSRPQDVLNIGYSGVDSRLSVKRKPTGAMKSSRKRTRMSGNGITSRS
jgi:Ca2+-binding RTX toxin-like protein